MIIRDRDYQISAVDSVFDYWSNGGDNPLVEMATGTGKSVVIAKLTKTLLTQWPDIRILMLVHVKELVEQNAMALVQNWQQAPIGINSAGLGRRDYHSQILFASVQSVFKRPELLGPRDVVMIDEAHLIPRSGSGMYRKLLEKLRENVQDLRVCGFTATPYRLDSGRLDEGEGKLFDEIVYSYDLRQAVEDGWLCSPVGKATKTQIDVSGVGRSGGDFVASALEKAADKVDVVEGACDEIVVWGQDRRSWLAFCSGVEHAIHVRDALRRRGVSCETVTGETPSGERARIFKSFKAGQIQCLTGVIVFTTGFDAPQVDLIAMLRPTLSTVLYVQKIGRGTRALWPHGFDPNAATRDERLATIASSSKPNCLVVDFAGNCRRFGPVDAVSVSSKKKEDSDGKPEKTDPDTVRAKICPACQTYNGLSTLECVSCGFLWPKPEPKHSAEAEIAPVMSREITNKWLKVDDVRLDRHRKFDGNAPDSMKVEYVCGFQVFNEWVCIEHLGFARGKAEAWWNAMGGVAPSPKTIDEAMSRAAELDMPAAITIMRDGKFWKVSSYKIKRKDGREVVVNDRYRVVQLSPPAAATAPPWERAQQSAAQ